MVEAAKLNDVLAAMIDAGEDAFSGVVFVNAIARHREVSPGYKSRCLLPCGCEGCIVQFQIFDEDEMSEIIWVH